MFVHKKEKTKRRKTGNNGKKESGAQAGIRPSIQPNSRIAVSKNQNAQMKQNKRKKTKQNANEQEIHAK